VVNSVVLPDVSTIFFQVTEPSCKNHGPYLLGGDGSSNLRTRGKNCERDTFNRNSPSGYSKKHKKHETTIHHVICWSTMHIHSWSLNLLVYIQ